MKPTKRVKKKKWNMPDKNDIVIERIGFDDDGHVTFVDLHDERFGEAIFCEPTDRHYHGKYNTPPRKE